jgi:hypothetical protein
MLKIAVVEIAVATRTAHLHRFIMTNPPPCL